MQVLACGPCPAQVRTIEKPPSCAVSGPMFPLDSGRAAPHHRGMPDMTWHRWPPHDTRKRKHGDLDNTSKLLLDKAGVPAVRLYYPAGCVISPRQSAQSMAMLACGIGLPMQSPRAYVDPIHKFERLSDHTLGDRLCQRHASCHGKQCGRRGPPGLLVRRCCR